MLEVIKKVLRRNIYTVFPLNDGTLLFFCLPLKLHLTVCLGFPDSFSSGIDIPNLKGLPKGGRICRIEALNTSAIVDC